MPGKATEKLLPQRAQEFWVSMGNGRWASSRREGARRFFHYLNDLDGDGLSCVVWVAGGSDLARGPPNSGCA